jgi:hypothetical protein
MSFPRYHSRLGRLLPFLCLFCFAFLPPDTARWGFDAHRLINRSATIHLPAEFQAFAQWADDLETLSTAADQRKGSDAGESIKHYIDIDDYPEFFTGQLPHSYTEIVAMYGLSRVEGNGTAPWAIEASYDDLVQYFENTDWDGAVAAAADIGHYIGDLHSPLHLTLNYNGQLTGQTGIHRRHESNMTSQHLAELEPAPGAVYAISDPLEAVFDLIDVQYPGVARVLAADSTARVASGGSTSSSAYYNALWEEVGQETVSWIQNASVAVASLWYAAWIEAGSPTMPGATNSHSEDLPALATRVLPPVPNPFRQTTMLPFELGEAGSATLKIFDVTGRQVRLWTLSGLASGPHQVIWNGVDDAGARIASGVYQVVVSDAAGRHAFGQVVYIR